MTAPVNVAALLGSRICHDLISPMSAIGNGVELLQMQGAAPTMEMDLISDSLRNANARIRFFRVAFGAADAGQVLPRNETLSILKDLSEGNKFIYDWQLHIDAPRPAVRAAFLIFQCLETLMPRGGTMIAQEDNGNWTIEASATDVRYDSPYLSLLENPGQAIEITASKVHFLLLPEALAQMGATLRLDRTDGGLRVTF